MPRDRKEAGDRTEAQRQTVGRGQNRGHEIDRRQGTELRLRDRQTERSLRNRRARAGSDDKTERKPTEGT